MTRLEELCDELDLCVLSDVVAAKQGSSNARVYALGSQGDREGGIGFVLTPWFPSVAALALHCERNHGQIVDEGAPEC